MKALKFYNHYQGVGWKVGGRSAIEDWQATAKNWMLKAKELERENGNNVSLRRRNMDYLKVTKDKNYEEPL